MGPFGPLTFLNGPPTPRLYRATMEDAAYLLCLRNDPTTVAASRKQRPVEKAEHLAWLTAALLDPAISIYIAAYSPDRSRVGTVRLDNGECPDGCATELSLTVAPLMRGKGLARQLILLAMDANPYQCRRWIAEVRRENIPSLRAFLSAGWLIDGVDRDGLVFLVHERIQEITPRGILEAQAELRAGLGQPYEWGGLE